MLRRSLLGAFFATSIAVAALSAPGCWVSSASIGSDCAPGTTAECCPCPWPEDCPDGAPPLPPQCIDGGADGGDTDGGQALTCPPGTCAAPQADWDPVILASGAEIDLPVCPDSAPLLAFEGRPEPTLDPVCPTCTCDAPLGSCSLPTTWTVGSDACMGGGVNINFDPPADWDGTCTSNTAIPQGLLCGGVPCVASITIPPPVLEEAPCTPRGSEPLDPPRFAPGGFAAQLARACTRSPWPACETQGEVCLPSPGARFATCLMHAGDEPCPEGWPNKRLFYGQVDDQRQCPECTCGPPTGATCAVKVQVYGDAACSATELEVNLSPGMVNDCFPLMPGVALSGKAAELLDYKPGTCEPQGSEPVGDVVLADATTFCCLETVS